MKKFKDFLLEDITNATGWKRIGSQLGSNPGGQYEDDKGQKWYVKKSKSDDHAKNEILANELYKHLGVPVLDHQLVDINGKLGTASPWVEKDNYDPDNKDHISQIRKHFASHAFVANWDSVGLENDNQSLTDKGMTTLDTGGSLLYRAMGSPKGHLFNDKVSELQTFKNADMNETAAHVFKGISPKEEVDSARPLGKLKNETISSLVDKHGLGDDATKDMLKKTLIGRKQTILRHANNLASKHKLDPIEDEG